MTALERALNLLKTNNLQIHERRKIYKLISSIKTGPDFYKGSFREQVNFIQDPSRFKAIIASRRSGKSYGEGIYMLKCAYENPGVSILYAGLTRETAKRILLKDVLNPVIKKLKLEAKINMSELSVSLPNGSVIYILGLDSNESEKRKLFGQKYKLAVIDEAALYEIDLDELIYKVLQPAMADQSGTIVLSGMPSNIKRGLFYRITNGMKPTRPGIEAVTDMANGVVWSVHRWSAFQNPHIVEKFSADIKQMKEVNPNIEETSRFKQEYLGEWIVDTDKLVYKVLPGNLVDDYPKGLDIRKWNYVLGADLGWRDPSALALWAYHPNSDVAYLVKTAKKSGLDYTDFHYWMVDFLGPIKPESYMIDGASAQGVEELRRKVSNVPWQAATKQGKHDFICMVNDQLKIKKILINRTGCEELLNEIDNLVWDERSVKYLEDPRCANHCCDAMLYGYRKVFNHMPNPLKPELSMFERDMQAFENKNARGGRGRYQ